MIAFLKKRDLFNTKVALTRNACIASVWDLLQSMLKTILYLLVLPTGRKDTKNWHGIFGAIISRFGRSFPRSLTIINLIKVFNIKLKDKIIKSKVMNIGFVHFNVYFSFSIRDNVEDFFYQGYKWKLLPMKSIMWETWITWTPWHDKRLIMVVSIKLELWDSREC